MITSVDIKNYKSLRKVHFEPRQFSVLVGPNASGKTSALEALAYLGRMSIEAYDPVVRSQHAFLTPGVRSATVVRVDGASKSGYCSVAVSATPMWDRVIGRHELIGLEVEVKVSGKAKEHDDRYGHYLNDDLEFAESYQGTLLPSPGEIDDYAKMRGVHETMYGFGDVARPQLYQFDRAALCAASTSSAVGQLERDGSGLPGCLAYLATSAPEKFAFVQQAMRSVVPGLRFTLPQSAALIATPRRAQPAASTPEIEEVPGLRTELLFHNGRTTDLSPQDVGDGTLRMLAILAAVCRGGVVLIDEMDRGLHPKAQQSVIQSVRELLKAEPHAQVIATTHSPYLVDEFDPSEVFLLSLGDDQTTHLAPLAAHPDVERWKESMGAGEIWSALGDSWVSATDV